MASKPYISMKKQVQEQCLPVASRCLLEAVLHEALALEISNVETRKSFRG
jgi:hypothetical protein